MHLVGDVHQPLHATSRWTKDHPKGDKGGNTFLIKRHKSVKNLHSLWDSGVFAYTKQIKKPFTKKTWQSLK